MGSITRIGQCSVCQGRAVLVDLACEECRDKFGPRCGRVANKIRTDPSFARYAYNELRKRHGSEFLSIFIEWFDYPMPIRVVK